MKNSITAYLINLILIVAGLLILMWILDVGFFTSIFLVAAVWLVTVGSISILTFIVEDIRFKSIMTQITKKKENDEIH